MIGSVCFLLMLPPQSPHPPHPTVTTNIAAIFPANRIVTMQTHFFFWAVFWGRWVLAGQCREREPRIAFDAAADAAPAPPAYFLPPWPSRVSGQTDSIPSPLQQFASVCTRSPLSFSPWRRCVFWRAAAHHHHRGSQPQGHASPKPTCLKLVVNKGVFSTYGERESR